MIQPTLIPSEITDDHWYAMSNNGLAMPIHIAKANLKKSFIYQRNLGVMPCGDGLHTCAAALLVAFNMGLLDSVDAQRQLENQTKRDLSSHGMMDYWLLNTAGTAFLSSVSRGVILAGKRENLNAFEIRFFGEHNIRYMK